MNTDNKSWYKGSLPNWMLVVLVSLMGYFCNRALSELDAHKSALAMHDTRMAVLENESKQLKDSITDLRLSNRDILLELKSMNIQLRK